VARTSAPTTPDLVGKSQDFTLAQNARKTLAAINWEPRSVAVFNPTPFYVHFPDLPAAFAWVQPNTQNAVVPVPPGTDRINVNSIDVPAGFPAVPSSTLSASLTLLEMPMPPSTGAPISAAPSSLPTQSVIIDVALAINGTAVLIAAVAGKTIYLFEYIGVLDAVVAAGWYRLRDAGASTNVGPEFATSIVGPMNFRFGGLALIPGNALGILNSSAGAIQLRGGLTFNQA
jgi:hypothetical protein